MVNSINTLENYLNEKIKESESAAILNSTYELNKSRIERYLPSILATFPHYSEHNQYHSKKIISSIERILGENQIRKLTVADVWLILNCAYMHDIGMIITERETRETFKTPEFSEFLNKCECSGDEDIRNAAVLIKKPEELSKNYSYDKALDLKRNIILLISEYYRPKHTERISEHVNNTKSQLYELFNMSFYNEVSPRIQNTISKICSMHGKNFSDIIDKLPLNDTLFEYDIHPRLIAALIRIGDLCDMDNDRFNLVNMAQFGNLTQTNIHHYFKHQTIDSLHISTTEISIKADVNFMRIEDEYNNKFCKVERKIDGSKLNDLCSAVIKSHKDWEKWLSQEVQSIKQYWNKIGDSYIDPISLDVNYEILINGEKSVTSSKNLCFNFSTQKAFSLIERSLYDNEMIFVRELIQNSTDAIKLQFWRDINNGIYDYVLKEYIEKNKVDDKIDYSKLTPFDIYYTDIFKNYIITIEAKYNEKLECGEFNIADNGIGISTSDLENNILKTGVSWKERKEYKDEINGMPEWLKPTGGFGIGLHSVFALTDCMKVESKSQFEMEGNNIFLSTGKNDGYAFAYKDKTIKKRGTKISFNCKKEQFEFNDSKNGSPFTYKPIDPFVNAISYIIKKYFNKNIFPIMLNNDSMNNFIFEHNHYYELFNKDNRNKLLYSFDNSSEEFDFSFTYMARDILVYDKKEHLACVLSPEQHQNIIDITYKNVRLDGEQFNDENGILNVLKIDILGSDVKDVILYDRRSLNNEYKDKLKNRLKYIRKFALDRYEKLLIEVLQNETVIQYNEEILELGKNYIIDKDMKNLVNEVKKLIEKYYKVNDKNKDKNLNSNIQQAVYMQIFENLLVQYDEEICNLFISIITIDFIKDVNELSNNIANEFKKRFSEIINYILSMEKEKIIDTSLKHKDIENIFAHKLLELIGAKIAQVFENDLKNKYDKEEIEIILPGLLRGLADSFDKILNLRARRMIINGNIESLSIACLSEFKEINYEKLDLDKKPNYWKEGDYSPLLGISSPAFCQENQWDFQGDDALKLYWSIPIMKVVFMGIKCGVVFEDLLAKIDRELGKYSTFKINKYFSQCNNLTDLVMNGDAKIPISWINKNILNFLPVLYDSSWKGMHLKGNVLYVEYNINNVKKCCILANDKCIKEYFKRNILQSNRTSCLVIPAFTKYSNIAMDFIPKGFENDWLWNNNLTVMLWDNPKAIYEIGNKIVEDKHKERIVSVQEELKNVTEEILKNNEVQSLIQFIHKYSKNKDLSIVKITETYKTFIEDVLSAVCLE